MDPDSIWGKVRIRGGRSGGEIGLASLLREGYAIARRNAFDSDTLVRDNNGDENLGVIAACAQETNHSRRIRR